MVLYANYNFPCYGMLRSLRLGVWSSVVADKTTPNPKLQTEILLSVNQNLSNFPV